MSSTPIFVMLRQRDEESRVFTELLYANHVGMERYELLSSSCYLPFCLGDIVEAPSVKAERLVQRVIKPSGFIQSFLEYDAPVLDRTVEFQSRRWRRDGAIDTRWMDGRLSTAWHPGLHPDTVHTYLVNEICRMPGWRSPSVFSPEQRLGQPHVDLAALAAG